MASRNRRSRSVSISGSLSGNRDTSKTSAGGGTGRRSWSTQRLCATRYSHAQRAIGRSEARSELFAGAAALAEPLFEAAAAVEEEVAGADKTLTFLHGLYWLC